MRNYSNEIKRSSLNKKVPSISSIRIEQLDVKYAPFANNVRKLARGFEDDKIVALVDTYL